MAYLEMRDITKCFGSVTANNHVNFSVEKGEIHALLGENGAGKSTLMNILYGLYTATSGDIFIDGKEVEINSPLDAVSLGIGMVHQHFMLIPALTVIENIVLGHAEEKEILDLNRAAKDFEKFAERFGMKVDPWVKVSQLTVGQQQRLEILKALSHNAKILILDEPTAVLTPQEGKALFSVIRNLKEQGITVLFISHKLVEIMEICDRCTILRQGKKVITTDISSIKSVKELACLMVGHSVEFTLDKKVSTPKEKVLVLDNINYVNERGVHILKDISFDLRAGEILGVCGVDGNGQSELIKCISGLLKCSQGDIRICGNKANGCNVRSILNMGVSHIPEDRQKYGMVADMSICENIVLMNYWHEPFTRKGFVNKKLNKEYGKKLCDKFTVVTPSIDERMGNLSGGNQQKVVLARELDRHPKLLLATHPDRGLDVAATKYIQKQIILARDAGAAVLLVSTELDEIMEISDRIMVMFDGRVMDIMDQADATIEKLGLLMAGATIQ